MPQTEFVGWDGALQEFNDAAAKYQMPDGQVYRQPHPMSPDASYEKSWGITEAVGQWSCAWGLEYADWIGKDPERAAKGLEMYKSFTKTDAYKNFWDKDSAQSMIEAAIAAADLGDPSVMNKLMDPVCRGKIFAE